MFSIHINCLFICLQTDLHILDAHVSQQELILITPEDGEIYGRLAKEYYIKSLKLNNCNLLIYYDIAQLYIDIKNYNQSQIYFEQYFDLINNSNIITKNKNNNNIHIIHYKYSQLLFYKLNKKK
eukprot:79448_1